MMENLPNEFTISLISKWNILFVLWNYTEPQKMYHFYKATLAIQRCSVENNKGAIAIAFIQL